ncbi:MAG: penicillin-binding protein 2, partial [Candidatus Chisholmbacteria bacterium]|nr:penicillin-binding protein 2 [Candidatus Chisholmbacteria bacterium]
MWLLRLKIALIIFAVSGASVVARLFYWQIVAAENLSALAESQHLSRIEIPAQRGRIITSDGFTLVGNEPAFLAYAYLPDLDRRPDEIASLLAPLVRPETDATASAKMVEELTELTEATLSSRLSRQDVIWVPLARKILDAVKTRVLDLKLKGLGFEPENIRFYPEASLSASLIGFVGDDVSGNPKGYFGLEGYYDLELKGRPGIVRQEKDATGKPILVGNFGGFAAKNGRDLKLYLDRAVQRLVEIELEEALTRYGAKSGEVIIMDPKSGGIIAQANLPKYDPQKFSQFDSSLYRNPSIAAAYEPGSTFKVLIMSAALDSGVVKPTTRCDMCGGPVTIGKYTIRTWNNEYFENPTMIEVIQRSNNIGMVFVGQKLGEEKLVDYLKKFGIGSPTGVDLQEESVPELRERWGDIDIATTSFGQGIAITALQMLRAVSAIANYGVLMEPHVVSEILGDTTVKISPKEVNRVISQKTAEDITAMMVNAVDSGEAQWTKLPGYKVAGKTGTAQIPVAGHYDEDKTIASFVGFAPADDPKFAMLVKLEAPTSSP